MKLLFTSLLLLVGTVSPAEDMRRVIDLRGYWKFSIGDNPDWALPEYNDSNWEELFVPAPWENEGFSGFDGYAWYRITLDLRNVSSQNLYLVLGYIDDVDQVYINGQMIGFSGSFPPNFYTAYNSLRKYPIPTGLLNKNGKNTIAVRVYDTVLEGGIIKGDIGIYTNKEEPENTLSLEGIWKFREGSNQWWKEPEYDDRHWKNILVPGFWESLKKSPVDDEAWYRKQVTIPSSLQKSISLVLVLGLIDDFDETYFNGVLVGKTNDGKHFGASQSWRTFRVYYLPPEIIKWDRPNIIAVHVKDIGVNAGIYKGPIGIVPEDQYKKLIWTRRD